jgi:PPK2 family polyphosphate:nucleotide phosphotransferase
MKNQPIMVPEGEKVKLADYDTDYKGKYQDKLDARDDLVKNLDKLRELQELLYASKKSGVLIVLQGTDASGKDGTIRHVMDAFNPQGCSVSGFKTPTSIELAHDFLWRIHLHTPPRGGIVIFNRSHYEDVLIVRVENLVPENVWKERYDHINNFERLLVDEGTLVLKFFLHISEEEQKERFQQRLDDPTKNWKFNVDDLEKRKKWSDYIKAYEEALTLCNTPWAPWHIVPADRKWYRNLVVSEVLVDAMEKLDMKYPPLEAAAEGSKIK